MNTEEMKLAFCKNLLKLRKSLGMTQADAASKLGISDKTYSKWETGENDPDLSSISKLAACFEVEPAALFTGESENIESSIDREFDDLTPPEMVHRAFGLQLSALHSLAVRAVHGEGFDSPEIAPPENLINPGRDHSITVYACPGTYLMQYNGTDANIGLSLLPAKTSLGWLISERERLAAYLSLLGETDFLRMLPVMLGFDQSERFTAEYLAVKSGVPVECAAELLVTAKGLGILSSVETHIGERTAVLYRVEADQMLLGILTLAHLSLPGAEKNGCWYFNSAARQIMVEGSVK